MGIAYNTSLITNGLIMYVDAANPRSYPGTGNTWYDLSGNNNHMTLVNGVTYSTASGGVLQTDGTNDYISLYPFNLATTNHTIMGASRYSGATRGRIITSRGGNWLLGHWANYVRNYYANGNIRLAPDFGVPGDAGNTNWYISTAVENYSSDIWTMYSNGEHVITSSNGTTGPDGFSIGAWQTNLEFSTGEISFLMVYNRLLSATEIKQNYNATKKRFGL
jgi:hypothetical protein